MDVKILTRKKRPQRGLSVARLTKIPVEQLLSPTLVAVPSSPVPTPLEPVLSAVAGGA